MPPAAFTSKDFLALEIEKIFERSWLWAPCDIPKEKEWAPFELLGRKMFLMCDDGGAVRAFPNACTHKWRQLVEKKGGGSRIVCRYHGRQFSTDGRFLMQTRCEGLKDFPREADNLKYFSYGGKFGFPFVSFGTPDCGLDELLGPLCWNLFCLPVEEMTAVYSGSTLIEGNWKYHLDNYVDELHLKFVHGGKGGLADETDIGTYTTVLHPHSTVRWVYTKYPEDGFILKDFPRPLFGLWWHIFPNLTVNIWKGGISLNAYEPDLEDPSKTNLVVRHYAWDKKEFADARKRWDEMHVDTEDLEVVGGVQKVIRHTPAPRGRFTPDGEAACHWFQRKIYEKLFA